MLHSQHSYNIKDVESNPRVKDPGMVTLLYDGNCQLCGFLAYWVERRSKGAIRIAKHSEDKPESIGLVENGVTKGGLDAWVRLMELHPDLKTLAWVGARLGYEKPIAKNLDRGAKLLRKMCRQC